MKKTNWLYFIIAIVLLTNCKGKVEEQPITEQTKPDSASQKLEAKEPKEPKETIRTVISLAQLVLDTVVEKPALLKGVKGGSVKVLWNYDEKLYLTSNRTKKFIVTKEINPCCPCSSTDPMCCTCAIDTDLAGVSDMNASLSFDNVSLSPNNSIAGIDYFTIPRDTGVHVLTIRGTKVPEVKYKVLIENSTIKFLKP